MALTASPARAKDIEVTNLNDSGPGSLRHAILAANGTHAADRIVFASKLTGTIHLKSELPAPTVPLAIDGPGANRVTVSGHHKTEILYTAGSGHPVTISGLTLKSGVSGGAIFEGANGHLTVINSVITGNKATAGGGISEAGASLKIVSSRISNNAATQNGGGIYVDGGSVTIISSVISGNTALDGGAIYERDGDLSIRSSRISGNVGTGTSKSGDGGTIYSVEGGQLTIRASTISGNHSGGIVLNDFVNSNVSASTISGNHGKGEGGGLFAYFSSMSLVNSTIAGNTAQRGGGIAAREGSVFSLSLLSSTVSGNHATGFGGGIESYGVPGLSNTIVAGNGAPQHPDIFSDSNVMASYSLIEKKSGLTFVGSANIFGKDPKLGKLANNGGPTQTEALTPGSPAIDEASKTTSAKRDQRGYKRDSKPDIGAFEFGAKP